MKDHRAPGGTLCRRRTDAEHRRQFGFALLEVFIGGAILAVAIMGTTVGVLTSYGLAIKTKKSNLANDIAMSVAEECLDAASVNFDTALGQFHMRSENHGDTKVKTEVVLDETVFSTPFDLNGDGDCDDTNLLPSECTAAFLRTTVTFRDGVTRTFLNLVSRRRDVRKTVAAAIRKKTTGNPSATSLSTAKARAIKAAIAAKTATGAQIAAYKAWLAGRRHPVTTGTDTLTSVALAPATREPRGKKPPTTRGVKPRTADNSREMVRATRVVASGSSIKSTWEADKSRVVVAMQIDTHKQLFVGRLKVNGVRVFSNPYRAAPTGTLFRVAPFKLEAGYNRLDDLLMLRSNYGGRISTRGLAVAVTLYFESGGKARFNLERS